MPALGPRLSPHPPAGSLLIQPALLRFRPQLANEQIRCWSVVTIAAIGFWPVGYWLGLWLASLFPSLAALGEVQALPQWLTNLFTGLGIGSLFAAPLAWLGGFWLPALLVVWAVALYRRELRIATGDFVWGWTALALIDESYGRLIEEARAEHYRPSINPVAFGQTLPDRINHFAHYYALYYRISRHPGQLKPPAVIETNCWMDGSPACLAGCLNTCFGIGLPLAVPLLLRIVLTWPRVLARKHAAYDYFSGKYDLALERAYGATSPVDGRQL